MPALQEDHEKERELGFYGSMRENTLTSNERKRSTYKMSKLNEFFKTLNLEFVQNVFLYVIF